MLTIRLFGSLDARIDDVPVPRLHAREGERLLAYFTLFHGVPIPYRKLAEVFWPAEIRMHYGLQGDFPNARQAVFSLRQALGSESARLASQGKGILCFDLNNADVDIVTFDRLASAATSSSWEEAIRLYEAPVLETWTDKWVVEARTHRRKVYERLLRRLIVDARETGNLPQIEPWLRRGQASSPEDESWTRELIELLATQGRYLDVEETYEEIRARLQEQNRSLEPELEARFAQIRGEARRSLMPPASTVSEAAPAAPIGTVPFRKEATAPIPNQTGVHPAAVPSSPTEIGLEPGGGAVALGSRFYIARPADARFMTALARPDSIVLVKGAHQMGKTSLLARGLQQARTAGARVVLSDFQSLNDTQVESPDSLFFTLATGIALQLDLDVAVRPHWNPDFGASLNLEIFLRQHVLGPIPGPFVWGMDEVDRLFHCPFRNEVFGLFRSWHNRRSLDPAGPWGRLTLAMAYATEAHLFITDVNQSPFNVGTRVVLEDFTLEQVAELNTRYGKPLRNTAEIDRLYALLCGHPYLTRLAFDAVVLGSHDLDHLAAHGDSDDGPFGDHLRRLFAIISRDAEMMEALREMLQTRSALTPTAFYRLRGAGIVAGEWGREIRMRSPIYTAYFSRHL